MLELGPGYGQLILRTSIEAKVRGIDLSPIQPPFVPPNVSFEIDDLEERWTFNEKFDFIHSRLMTGSFASFPAFFAQSFDALNSGGYIEVCIFSSSIFLI